ncbi:3-deoxy-manno-octulosonate cytidylyltransferase [Sulfurovum sp.]|uniref:3-deoxy-manno-octulosonate cytidylyltransferase n=1 Tax=Sulfurovum sp. TaxID=1969726 RepID=UPI0028682B98|nr:3-deoxy-manno-octulosonate cytidylyltransferase [Sulfurovum sp.]
MIIIPARIGSSRFPNKVLADIGGIPMVIRTAKAVEDIDNVVIATDSQEVIAIASNHGIQAILTSSKHQSGTDRIYEAAQKLDLDENEIVINVQGDEPFIETAVVWAVYNLTKKNKDDDRIMMNSCYKIISNPEADDPNIVKVVTDSNSIALYFSRAKIPYSRDHHFNTYKGHLGIYGFTVKSLRNFCMLNPAPLEEIEKLEQLRALYHSYSIAMTEVQTESFGIDTVEDLEKAIKHHNL